MTSCCGPGMTEVDDHGGAADGPRRGTGEEILGRHGAHERQLHMGVGVDAARHDIAAAGIHHFRTGRCLQIFPDRVNLAALVRTSAR